jgi:thiol-disulfide isomerase/thioredoxin
MKKSILIVFAFFLAFNLIAQGDYKASNEGWLTNLDEAYAKSKASGKPIMANFTGSDWCGWCKKLSADVFVKPEFKEWAAKNVVLLELDFPRMKTLPEDLRQQNAGLQQVFGVGGYPTVWLFNMSKDETKQQYSIEAIGKTGYMQDAKAFTANADNLINAAKK